MMVLLQISALFILMTVGFILGKQKIVDSAGIRTISSLIVKATLPALIITSLQRPFTSEMLSDTKTALLISSLYYIGAILLGILFTKILRCPENQKGPLAFSLGFSNSAFIGFPVISSILGSEALFITSIQNLPFNLLAFSAGIIIISGKKSTIPVSRVFNSNVIAAVVGFLLFIFSIQLPQAIMLPLTMLGGLTTPLAMIATGAMLARSSIRLALGNWRLYVISLARLALFPLITAEILKFFGVSGEMFVISVVIAGMPAASNTGLLAEVYGADTDIASSIVCMTTLFSVITIPILALLIH